MMGKDAESVLNRAVRFAMEKGHEYFTLEHVLWSLLSDRAVVEVLRACGGDPFVLRKSIEDYVVREIPKSRGAGATETPEHPVATQAIQRLVQRAHFQVQSAGREEIRPIDLFVAFFQAKDSYALYLMARQGVERLDVINYISHGLTKDGEEGAHEGHDEDGESHDSNDEKESFGSVLREEKGQASKAGGKAQGTAGESSDPLKQYAVNLNERAKKGKIDPLVGRASEVERMIQTLCRRRKNNPLLVGEAGVGKTALAEGLALRIVSGDVPDLLTKAIIFQLDMGTLVAGTKFRGDFEQRIKQVIQALNRRKEKGELPILLIDEIHTLVGAGSVSGGSLDAANLFKPLLARGELRCIGTTTYSEYRSSIEKDHALARRFQKIDVIEPSVEEAVSILQGLAPRFEEFHQVKFSPEAIRAAVELSAKHLTDRHLPDKAVDILDEAGAKARLKRKALAEGEAPRAPTEIGVHEIEEMIALIARIPARSVNTSQKERLKNLGRDLRMAIFGQDAAIDAIVTSVRLSRSGLRAGDKPIGNFLFCGPTGVGKTELSKQLALCLGVGFQRFDMSEYGEKHTVSRLIGAPPGYVGFEQAGVLTDAVSKHPHSVILLDEIEKAHPDIWNILLQVMDHGTLTDNNGKKADFRNVILIMTSNVGSREMERRGLGMATEDTSSESKASKAVESTFSPEFRNRLDAIVYFNALDPRTVEQVVSKHIVELESLLLSKNVDLDVTVEARKWLATKGYDRKMGARPLARLIQDKVKRPLSEEILFGKLEQGGTVHVRVSADELMIDVEEKPATGGVDAKKEGAAEPVSG